MSNKEKMLATGERGPYSLIWQIGNTVGSTINREDWPGPDPIRGFIHDIKSPLTVIGMLKPRLAKIDGDAADLLQYAINQIECLSERLRPQKAEQTSAVISKELVNCRVQIRSFCRDIERLISAKRIEYANCGSFSAVVNVNYDPSDCIPGTLGEWESILSNLLNNSVESSKEFVNAMVEIGVVDHYLQVTVRDDGPGLLQEQIKRFNWGRPYTSKNGEGGYGLRQAVKYIKTARGEIKFENAAAGGLKVTMLIPILKHN